MIKLMMILFWSDVLTNVFNVFNHLLDLDHI